MAPGGDSERFRIANRNQLRMTSATYGQETYTVNITVTGSRVFENGNNSTAIEVTVTREVNTFAAARVTSTSPYAVGDTAVAELDYKARVTVETTGGTPTVRVRLGGNKRSAAYVSTGFSAPDDDGNVTSTLRFEHTVDAEDDDTPAAYVVSNSLQLNGGTIDAATAFHVAPRVISVAVGEAPGGDGTWDAGVNPRGDARVQRAGESRHLRRHAECRAVGGHRNTNPDPAPISVGGGGFCGICE